MKTSIRIAMIAFATALLSTGSFAQGRHDEKPHGMTKPAASSSDTRAGTGGRHDEGPTSHGTKKAAKKKSKDEAATETK
jgi:hypothetical protein